jgi:hypothetical protein
MTDIIMKLHKPILMIQTSTMAKKTTMLKIDTITITAMKKIDM